MIFHFYGIGVSFSENLAMAGWFTVVSIIRSYVLRRVFNRIKR